MEVENTKKNRKYGNREMQNTLVNTVLVIGTFLYYVLVFINVYVAYKQGFRSSGYTMMILFICGGFILLNTIIYLKNRKSKLLKIFASIGLCVIYFLITSAFVSEYLRYLGLVPLFISILYFDKKHTSITCTIIAVINFATYYKIMHQDKAIAPDMLQSYTLTMVTVTILIVLIYVIVHIGARFNHDALYNLMDEKQMQQVIMDEVLKIAENVRNDTQNASTVMDELDESTKVVNVSVSEISDATSNIAENIQEQTTMTQDIHQLIGQTIEHFTHMAEMADASGEAVAKNRSVIKKMQQQSKTIASTNEDVSKAMDSLQARTEDVKNIADVIFNISSQTNLLALNASIESARAGEAGKGFAVVADEIRKLAEETRKETESIAKILDELNTEASAAKTAVDQSVSATDEQEGLIGGVSNGFEGINNNMNELTQDIKNIETMLDSLLKSNNRIVDNITQLSAATEEVTANSLQSKEISESNKQNADTVKELLESIVRVSYGLNKYVEHI